MAALSQFTHLSIIAKRYAQVLLDLARESGQVEAVGKDVAFLDHLLESDEAFSQFVHCPLYSKAERTSVFEALEKKLKSGAQQINPLVINFLKVVAARGRLSSLKEMLQAYPLLVKQALGEVAVEVVSAAPLSAQQEKTLKSSLKEVCGKNMGLTNVVDPAILGGLIIRWGSSQIDTSLSTKLSSLKLALKEVG